MNGSEHELERVRFVGALTHELRGHLNEIGLATSLSRRALESGMPTRSSAQLDRIEERIRDLAELVDDLQDALGHSVVRTAQPSTTSLHDLVDAAFERVQRMGAGRGISVTIARGDDIRIELDVAKARRLAQLVALALVDLGSGGSLDVRTQPIGAGRGRVTLSFELHRKWPPEGEPLGTLEGSPVVAPLLAHLAQAVGATLGPRVRAIAGGVVQRFTLPARLVASEPEVSSLRGLEGLRLLVVEDDRDARSALALLLEDWGFEVVEAESGEDGVEAAGRQRPRLALLDIELPGDDGFAVRDLLRRRDPLLPVIFLSGSERHIVNDDPDPATRYLMKPVELETLESALRELLDAREEHESAPTPARASLAPPKPPKLEAGA